MNQEPSPHRRWYQFNLRTMFVLTLLVSIPLAWVGYSLNWIMQRKAVFRSEQFGLVIYSPGNPPVSPPALLWMFGEDGKAIVSCDNDTPENLRDLQRLFPEAEVRSYVVRSSGRRYVRENREQKDAD